MPRGQATAQSELVDDVLALLDAMALERVWVIGHELGGRIGFHLSLRAPDRVRGHLALNAMHPYWRRRWVLPQAWQAWREWWTPFVETPLVGRTVLQRVPPFMRLWFRLGSPAGPNREHVAVDEYLAALQEPARARAAEAVQQRFAYHELIPTVLGRYRSCRLTVPTLMLAATHDFALGPTEMRGYQPYTDRLEVELVNARHFMPEECPDLVTSTARAFFDATAAASPTRTGR